MIHRHSSPLRLCFALLSPGLLFAQDAAAPAPLNIPIAFDLEQAATVTVVIDDADGKRVRNLMAATRLPPGPNLLSWDGYDDGEVQKDGSTLRRLVAPGTYRVRGLTHNGLRLIYEFPIQSPGQPPWFTPDRSGAWLADHTSPQSVVFLPASDDGYFGKGKDRVIVSAITAECGDAFMALDSDGKKIVGLSPFGWHGGYALAVDRGPDAPRGDDAPWLYALRPGGRDVIVNAFARGGKTFRLFRHQSENPIVWNGGLTSDSIAVWNGIAVISVPHDNELLVVDARAKRLIGRLPVEGPRGVLFDDQGRLLLATAKQVKRLTLDTAKPAVLREEVVIGAHLEDAQQLALDPSGNLYVGDWGSLHVVKQFDPAGRPMRVFGKPGGPQLGGGFDYERLHYPKGLAVDARGQLWVVNADHLPKRISVWSTADGALVRSFVGGPKYGGGGALDPQDRTRFYYGIFNGGYSMKLDWAKGTAVVDNVFSRPEQFRGLDRDRHVGQIPDNAFHVGGHTFLIPNYTAALASNNSIGTIWHLGKDGVAWPVALVGALNLREPAHGAWNPERNPGVQEFFDDPGDGKKLDFYAMLIWSDLNRDGRAQPEEFRYWRTDTAYIGNNIRFNDDLSFTVRGHSFPAPTILPNGVPVWSQESALTPLTGAERPSNTTTTADGWTLAVGRDHRGQLPGRHNAIFGWRDGERKWEYPSLAGEIIPHNPGDVIMAQRFLGAPFLAQRGEAGTVFGVNGEKGSMYLMTTDGLFLQDLGGDMRTHPTMGQKYPDYRRGMVVEGVTFLDEHFGPSLSQTKEGDVILIAGKEYSAIFRVDGLQDVRRRDFGALTLDAARLAGLPETLVVASRQRGPQTLTVAVGGEPPVVDGNLADWPETGWVRLDDRASASLRIVDGVLYAAWRTGDPHALANASGEPRLLFKRGGAVDLMIAADPGANPRRRDPVAGDQRLLASLQDGIPTAVLYRSVVPGTRPEERVPFESPVGRVEFDRVEVVSERIRLAQRGGDIELAVPLDLLGVPPLKAGMQLQGDIGLLRGTGAMTTQRLYWSNLDTSICSDVPSEARLMPWNWGRWDLTILDP